MLTRKKKSSEVFRAPLSLCRPQFEAEGGNAAVPPWPRFLEQSLNVMGGEGQELDGSWGGFPSGRPKAQSPCSNRP